MQHPDQKYIEALLNNDKVLIEEIYQKYSGKIKGMVLLNNGSEADAADVFQEILLSIYKKAVNQNFTLTCPLDAFLYVVCKNKWISELNKRERGKVTIKDSSVYNIDEDSFKLAWEFKLQEERKHLLTEKLAELCEDCRRLLQLSWSGKPMEEVARILNITYGYARKKKCECMARLVSSVKHSSHFHSLKW
ncbi:MAG: sigma-70 family RNA polymerase sigma factor [Ginsengibacter sp.]